MLRPLAAIVFASLGILGTLVAACGEDATVPEATDLDGSTTGKDGKASGSSSGDDDDDTEDSGTKKDAAGVKDGSDTCEGSFEAPDLDGPGPCGTDDFGKPAAVFTPVDPDGGATYSGTDLVDGIYDAVTAERSSGLNGSWRETFVVKGNRFTRIRQIDTGGINGLGPVSYRSGTFAYETNGGNPTIKLTYECAQTGENVVDAGLDDLPSDAVVGTDCSARYRYGVTGIRITLRRR